MVKVIMGLTRLRKLEQIAKQQAQFYGCASIEEYCKVYNIDYRFLFELCKIKLFRFKQSNRK